jgi:hypothetical protein
MLAVSPIDGEKWLEAVVAFSGPDHAERQTLLARMNAQHPISSSDYFEAIEDFLAGL